MITFDETTVVPTDEGHTGEEQNVPMGPVLTVLFHPDVRRIGERADLCELRGGNSIRLGRRITRFSAPGQDIGRTLEDPFISRQPILLVPGADGSVSIRLGVSRTHVLVDGREVHLSYQISGFDLAEGVVLELARRVVLLLHFGAAASEMPKPYGMIGASHGLNLVRDDIARVADMEVNVLIRGESGTGKELVARAIHAHGSRSDGPFLSINLGAVPRELVVSELFGAEKGAYTGASRQRDGLFVRADGGTLFLDEIGEASPEVQVALLRVMETGEVMPIGATEPRAVDVRLLAATDMNLEDKLGDGSFRLPLLHRLAGYEIQIPPLRARREDLGRLLRFFLEQELLEVGESDRLQLLDASAEPWFPPALAGRMARYHWPGNIRELKNLSQQIVIANRGRPSFYLHPKIDALLPPSRPEEVGAEAIPEPEPEPSRGRRKFDDIGADELEAVMAEHGWDIAETARHFCFSRPVIYSLIRKHGLRVAADIDDEEIARLFHAHDGSIEQLAARLRVSTKGLRRRLTEMSRRGALPPT